jgi:hypothetical protein
MQALTVSAWNSFFPTSRSLSGPNSSQGLAGRGFGNQRSVGTRGKVTPQPPTPAPTPTPAPVYVPPYDYTPGALIRTAGLGYTMTPANDAHYANNDPGYAIVQDPSQTQVLNPFPGVHVGPADKLPPPNPGLGGNASGRNAITPNSVASESN